MINASEGSKPGVTDIARESFRSTFVVALDRTGGLGGLIAAAFPVVVFVAVNAAASLYPALFSSLAAAVGMFGWRLLRREPLRQPAAGFLLVGTCAAFAVFTGEARGFFLVQPVTSVLGVVGSLVTIMIRRPLAGLLLNRIVGGPAGWWRQRDLLRVYGVATLLCAAVSGVEFMAQAALYAANQTAVLAAFNIVDPVIWSSVAVVIVVAARRAVRGGCRGGSFESRPAPSATSAS